MWNSDLDGEPDTCRGTVADLPLVAEIKVLVSLGADVTRVLAPGIAVLLGGCSMILFDPHGDIGIQERNLILLALGLMLLVVIPVILLPLYFAWRYRASNVNATYAPKWSHSTAIEVVVWTIPYVIVLIPAIVIWRTTRALHPYQAIESATKPLRVEVIALIGNGCSFIRTTRWRR